jgi:hypothetical protein
MFDNVNIQRIYDLGLGCVGGSVATIYVARKYGAASFTISLLISNISLGAFVGYLVGGVVPVEWNMHDILVSFSGVTAYSIIEIGETKFASYVYERLFNIKTGPVEANLDSNTHIVTTPCVDSIVLDSHAETIVN